MTPRSNKVRVYDVQSDGWVDLPRTALAIRTSVHGVLLRGTSVLVIKSINRGRYDLPGGGINPGESIAEALCREFVEETGVEVSPFALLSVTEKFVKLNVSTPPWQVINIIYLVEEVGGVIKPAGNGVDSFGATFVPFTDLDETNTIQGLGILEAVNALCNQGGDA